MNNRANLMAATAAAVMLHALAVCCVDYLLVMRGRAAVTHRAPGLPSVVAIVDAVRRGPIDWRLPPSAPAADPAPPASSSRPALGEPRVAEVPALTTTPAPVREGLPEGEPAGLSAPGPKAIPGASGGRVDVLPMWAPGGDETGGVVQPLEAAIFPRYPLAARLRGDEGTVAIAVLLDSAGELLAASIAQSSGFESLDAAALAAVRKAHFTNPQGGERAAVITVRFRLTE